MPTLSPRSQSDFVTEAKALCARLRAVPIGMFTFDEYRFAEYWIRNSEMGAKPTDDSVQQRTLSELKRLIAKAGV